MTLRLVERLNAVRQHCFVGRKQECDLFQSALAAPELPFSILYFFGPGGVGKTTLMWQLAQICHSAEIPVIYLDGRTFQPSPQSFLNALQSAVQLAPDESLTQFLATQPIRHILLIDSYERLASLEDWLREEFLPQLSEHMLVVLAGRRSPASAWRTDPGWQSLFHPLAIHNLSVEASQLYLTKRSIPTNHHCAIIDFTHGHPLALSLMADLHIQNQDITITSDATSSVIQALLATFLEEVPSSAHRMALEVCSVVRLTTESLLAELLEMPDVHEIFEWLHGLSFIEAGPFGLRPCDMVREVVVAELRWRNPDRWITLHQRGRNHYSARLNQTQGQEQHQILWDSLFLHHHQSAIKSRFVWQAESSLNTDVLREEDQSAILKMVTEHEGEASAKLAAYWLSRQPQNVFVFRNAKQQVSGFLMVVALHQASADDLYTDPAASAAWHYLSLGKSAAARGPRYSAECLRMRDLRGNPSSANSLGKLPPQNLLGFPQNHAPLRSGEGALLYRFWMARDTYQAISLTQTLIFINAIQHYRNTSGIAFTLFPCAEPEFWQPLFAYTGFSRCSEADFEVNTRRYGVYGHDWRVVPATVWWEQLGQREISNAALHLSLSASTESLLILSQPEFAQAVRDALRHFVRPDALRNSPLLRSRLVIEHSAMCDSAAQRPKGDRGSRVAVLQSRLQEATELLQASPRDQKLYRTLHHTYLHPALTQEQAAELLDLPFSTYRRYLKAGVARVADILWQREVLSI